jgi:hypothetical protein
MTAGPVETVVSPIRFATKAEAVYDEIRGRILRKRGRGLGSSPASQRAQSSA